MNTENGGGKKPDGQRVKSKWRTYIFEVLVGDGNIPTTFPQVANLSGNTSSKEKRALSRVKGGVLHTKS